MATSTARNTADSSSAQLYMGVEPFWAPDPTVVSPITDLTEVRFTGESLTHDQTTITSNEIRSDAQVTDHVRVGVGASGDVNFELSYGTFDRFFEGAMRNDWTAEVDINADSSPNSPQTVTIASPLNVISIPGSPALAVGRWIYVSGSATSPSNNGFKRITAVNGSDFTVHSAFNLAESGTNLRVRGGHLRNGTVKKSFLLAKVFTDLSPQEVLYFTGMRVGGTSFEVTPGQAITGSMSFLGKRGYAANSLAGLSGAATAPTGEVANAVDNVSDIELDDAPLDADLTGITFEVNNNTRDKPAVSSLGNIDIGLGRFIVNGNVTMYFSSRVLYNKFLAATAHSFSFAVTVGTDAYVFNFPSIKFSAGPILAEGNDGDVLANMDFNSRRDPTLGFTMSIDRFSNSVGQELN